MTEAHTSGRALVAAVVALLTAVLALWLFTFDVHSDIARSDGGADRPFCGSAYDVALLKHDGYMGGEPPGNQDAIDRDCVAKANWVVAGAGVAGLVAAVAGISAMRGFARRFERPKLALAGMVATVGVALGGLAVWLVLPYVQLLWSPVSIPTSDPIHYGSVEPTSEDKANLLLWVSNQSFSPETVHIDVQLDGVIVVHQKFAVESQHNWVKFPLQLSPGKHELIVVSDTGVKLVRYFTMPDEKLYAILDYWGEPKEDGHFTWQFQKEPAVFA